MGAAYSKKGKEIFKKMDLFSNPELLKHKGEGSYQTYTGATISVLIFILFTAAFFNYCKETINREKITSIPKTKPSLGTSFNTNSSNSAFMFVFSIEGIRFADWQRFFDIYMNSYVYKNGLKVSSQRVPLEPCLPEQWQEINGQLKKAFSRLNFKQRLCPPKNHNFIFQGKYTSQEFHFTKLIVRRCQPDNKQGCASDEEFNEMLQKHSPFKLSMYFANPIIDANENQYLDYVLQDTTFFEFSDRVGVSSHIFFSEYEVNTDRSVFPEGLSRDVVTERGLTLNQRPVVSNFEVINTDELVRIYLRKSDLIQQFDRSYTRFDVTFAYLGGLFGMMLMFCYLVRAFSEYAFEFQIGSDIFVEDDHQRSKFEPQKFNFLRFLLYLGYCFITFFYKPAENWSFFKFSRQVDECREEVKQQLDVSLLVKRLIYFENAIELLMSEKLSQLDINQKMIIKQAAQKRLFYRQQNKTALPKATEDKNSNPSMPGEIHKDQSGDRVPTDKEVQQMMDGSVRPNGDSDVYAQTDLGSKEYQQNMMQNENGQEIDYGKYQMISNNEQNSNAQLNRDALRNRQYVDNVRKSPQGPSAQSLSLKSSSNGSKDELENKENVHVSHFNLNNQKRRNIRRRPKNLQQL